MHKTIAALSLAIMIAACGAPEEGDLDIPDCTDDCDDAGPTVDADADVETDPDPDAGTEPDRSPVIDASVEMQSALCSGEYSTSTQSYDAITRGSWQFNPGGNFVELPEPGYPCRAFLYDTARPALADPRWTDVPDRDFIGFHEASTVSAPGYMTAQFRYFRTMIFVPAGQRPGTLTVKATGIDDALHLVIYNSAHPNGTSPTNAGPSDPEVGACYGNDHATWDVADSIIPGEINVILLVHADMSPATSTLASVVLAADGQPIQMVNCEAD